MYTTLVVDDDPQVLAAVAEILSEPGFIVVTARDAYEAIRVLADRHIDLMITDIWMPGLDGVELGIQAKLMRPRLHIIYITGYAGEALAQYGRVVSKPIRAAELIKMVKQEMSPP